MFLKIYICPSIESPTSTTSTTRPVVDPPTHPPRPKNVHTPCMQAAASDYDKTQPGGGAKGKMSTAEAAAELEATWAQQVID